AINAGFFGLEAGAGWLAHSLGLVADSLDMLADAFVYGLALWAVGRAAVAQQRVARAAGYLQLGLALGGLAETVRRLLAPAPAPNVALMVGIAGLALLGNVATLRLLGRANPAQAHIRASQIFTSTDVAVNLGVMLAAGLVYLAHAPWPDLVVGLVVFGLVGRGAWQIFALARPAAAPLA
ncbi:MAG: cation transporter, partial [Bacteroidota bacterium]|nr:cation transporter [Bacteroidota bacterium]